MYNLNGYLVKKYMKTKLSRVSNVFTICEFLFLWRNSLQNFSWKNYDVSLPFSSHRRIFRSKISRKSSVDSKISNSSLKIQVAEISYIFSKCLIIRRKILLIPLFSFTSWKIISVKYYNYICYEILKWTANVIGVCANFMYGIYKLRSVILITRLRNN